MSQQPHLPVNAMPKTMEYSPAGDESAPWMVGRWPDAATAFDLKEREILDWHLALAGQGRPWLVIRRIYNIAPLWGDGVTPDDIKPWTWAELSAALGVSEVNLKKDLAAAVEFWKKARLSLSVQRSAQATSSAPSSDATAAESDAKPLDGLPDFKIHQQFDEDQINSILTPFRFASIRSQSDRLYVANRIIELKALLNDKNTRESARTLIVMEMNMASHEATLQTLKLRLETLQKSGDVTKEQSAETIKISDSITSTEKALTTLSTTYRAAAAELGSDEQEAGEVRRVALGTISHLIEAHRNYYAAGDRALIDGMFTAEEVVWLTTPLAIRPAQYRPDIVLRVREACHPENLWDANYKPTVIQREACRRLHKLAQLMTDEEEPGVIEGIDDAVASSDDTDDPAEASQVLSDSLAVDSLPSETFDYSAPAPRPDDPCMGIG